jgi:carbonic anhydrase/acetyltransferase-like protein (isoleucine patch superfamily)
LEEQVPVYALGEHVPVIHPTAYVHPDAVVIGQVEVGAESTLWPGAVLRGDSNRIVVGERTSIQDGVVIHAGRHLPTVIGSGCVVGHLAHLEGCVVEDDVLVGSGSVLLHYVLVRTGALVAAGAVVSPRTEVPSYAIARGVPARIVPDAVEPGAFADSAARYVAKGKLYAAELRRLD